MIAYVCVCKGGRRGKEQAEGGRARRREDGVGEDGVGSSPLRGSSRAAMNAGDEQHAWRRRGRGEGRGGGRSATGTYVMPAVPRDR